MISKVFEVITKERAVGTAANDEIVNFLENKFKHMNYSIKSLPFECTVWENGKSTLESSNHLFQVEPSPFSEPFKGSGKLIMAKTVEELEDIDCNGVILLLSGKLTESPLQPKDYPFYYPEEHKYLISLLERKKPRAIIAVTGQNPLSGQNPFPLFEDGNFLIPSGNINERILSKVEAAGLLGESVHLTIDSHKRLSKSRQIAALKKAEKSMGKIVIGAHMDTKYNTPGALDNAAGVAVLIKVAEVLKSAAYDIEIVPFNSEEFYGACGEMEYLKLIDNEKDRIKLMINIDSPCHKGAETAISFHNLNDNISEIINCTIGKSEKIVKGKEWYAGDHVPFIFRGIPCLVVTSSDLFSGALEYTHTSKDTLDTIDFDMVDHIVRYIVEIISAFSG
ncbi:peptidase M28 [Clostridium carboxidivorans P7]|uniref:Peptidase M28 n=1 Tax=Clostridium carboxidivorans P7 TaxID=536227 RepID=C6Q1C0_9CLOT|nr:M28 family metallopeptidase [Clostridium carboxidivorans]AKN31527.1 peptidase M28 [Clostridium carboxidivorans P7]EET84702.1 peptidase M28 [Clostridium carboxidivorans P7]EFG87067.1 peptidase, M28 family [Clostridium carboxidivorans P7]